MDPENFQKQLESQLHVSKLQSVESKPVYVSSVEVTDTVSNPLSEGSFKTILNPLLSNPLQSLTTTISALKNIEKKLMLTGLYDDVSISLTEDHSEFVKQFLKDATPKDINMDLPLPISAQIKLTPVSYRNLSLISTTRDNFASVGGRVSLLNKYGYAETINLQGELNVDPFTGNLNEKAANVKCSVPFLHDPSVKSVFDFSYSLSDLREQPWIAESDQGRHRQLGLNIGVHKPWMSLNQFYTPTTFNGLSIILRDLVPKTDATEISLPSKNVYSKLSLISQMLYSNIKSIGTVPTQGVKVNFTNEFVLKQSAAGQNFGNTFDKLTLSCEAHRSFLSEQLTTSLNFSCGSIFSPSTDGKVPDVHFMDRFYVGGLSSLKGFQTNMVGNTSGDSFYRLGLYSSIGLPKMPKISPIKLQTFVNAGDVFALKDGIPEKFAAATGVSLIYSSRIGNLDLTYAIPLTSRPQDEAKPGFSFGVKIAFM
ncbi:HFL254Wp [Eremothecium sinecaudum]|uniref:HFL254Wp n=1 Tax=Eremothecium sinecaudum TaxID=45286 RepID=A0A109UXN1_9SACH|nr:HFL254Wp [Eremothecium sinecaudum]AMD21602.1 HFL254Wp [Eremothecium sinecaudum]